MTGEVGLLQQKDADTELADLAAGLLDQGMSPGATMSFVIAGGVSCIPAAVAVWALAKPQGFAACLGLALVGAITTGLIWGTVV